VCLVRGGPPSEGMGAHDEAGLRSDNAEVTEALWSEALQIEGCAMCSCCQAVLCWVHEPLQQK